MHKLGWYVVGLIYSLMVWGNFSDTQGSGWVSPDYLRLSLGLALLSVAIGFAASSTLGSQLVESSTPKTKRLALAGLFGLAIQLTLGALVRNFNAGLACPKFPNCLDHFLPIPWTLETGLTFAHRWWGVLMLGVFIHLALETSRRAPAFARLAQRCLGLTIAQIILGIGTIMSRLEPGSRMTHAAVAYALWGILFYMNLRTGGIRLPRNTPSPARELRVQ